MPGHSSDTAWLLVRGSPAVDDVDITRLDGAPTGEKGMDWPTCAACGSAMTFGGQLRVADAGIPELPDVMAVFFQCEEKPGDCETADADSGANRVILVEHSHMVKLRPPGLFAAFKRPEPGISVERVAFEFRAISGEYEDSDELDDDEDLDNVPDEELAPYSHAAEKAGRDVVGMMGPRPEWLQAPKTPTCPCGARMRFFATLEDDATRLNFGMGRAYFFACAACRLEARMLWQR